MIKRMVLVLCTAAAALAAVALSASPANAMPYIGISESFQDFGLKDGLVGKDVATSKYFSGLRAGSLRVIVPWDIAMRPASDPERRDFEQFLYRGRALQNQGMPPDPFVVFGPTENQTNIVDGSIGWNGSGYRAPTVSAYQTAIHAFVARYGPQGSFGVPRVRMIGAWNEPNREPFQMQLTGGPPNAIPVLTHDGQDMASPSCPTPASATNCGPRAAAYYWKTARDEMDAACVGSGLSCYAIAGEFTSGFGSTSMAYWAAYTANIDSLINANYPQQISFHGHHDVDALGVGNDCVAGGPNSNCITAVFANWLASKVNTPWANRANMAIWNTEIHSFYQSTSPGQYQLDRFKHLADLSDIYQVKRIYYFNFQSQGSDDYGLIAKGDINAPGANRPLWWYIRSRLTGNDTTGVFRPSAGWWYERNGFTGPTVNSFNYGASHHLAVAGDWDGNGHDTPGVYDPTTAYWYMRNGNDGGGNDYAFNYGFTGGTPIVGDWDGDGIDTPGLFNPVTGMWYLRNSNTTGTADITFGFGFAGAKPIVGDWDGNGTDTPGVFDSTTGMWYLRNSNSTGTADISFVYGFAGGKPIAGDWNDDGVDSIGLFDSPSAGWYLRNSNTTGTADVVTSYGANGDQPVAGDWDGV